MTGTELRKLALGVLKELLYIAWVFVVAFRTIKLAVVVSAFFSSLALVNYRITAFNGVLMMRAGFHTRSYLTSIIRISDVRPRKSIQNLGRFKSAPISLLVSNTNRYVSPLMNSSFGYRAVAEVTVSLRTVKMMNSAL